MGYDVTTFPSARRVDVIVVNRVNSLLGTSAPVLFRDPRKPSPIVFAACISACMPFVESYVLPWIFSTLVELNDKD
jgi:hypothetical protein